MTRRRKALGIAATAVVLVALLLGGAWLWVRQRSFATPGYWRPVNAPREQIAATAEQFERWMATQFTQHRPVGSTWSIAIDQRRVNEWLAARGRRWAANQHLDLPSQLGAVMVAFAPGRLILAGAFDTAGGRRIVSAIYEPKARTRPVELALTGTRVGTLALPPAALAVVAELTEPVRSPRLAVPLGDGRVVEVIAVELREGEVLLNCRMVAE